MRRQKQTKGKSVPTEQDTVPLMTTHGFVNLIPPPCESHRGGIQVDEPFWEGRPTGVCAVHPSLRRCHHASHLLVQGNLTGPGQPPASSNCWHHRPGRRTSWRTSSRTAQDLEKLPAHCWRAWLTPDRHLGSGRKERWWRRVQKRRAQSRTT